MPPSVFCGRIAFGAGHVLEWQICVARTWLRLSFAVPALLPTRAPWAWVSLHPEEEAETKVWESWEPLSLVCKHTGGLTHVCAGLNLFSS